MSLTIRLSNFKHDSESIHQVAYNTRSESRILIGFKIKHVMYVVKSHNPLINIRSQHKYDVEQICRLMKFAKKYGHAYVFTEGFQKVNRGIEIAPTHDFIRRHKLQPSELSELKRGTKIYHGERHGDKYHDNKNIKLIKQLAYLKKRNN